MNRQHLTLYGLKWNPFASDVPVESLLITPAIDSFCRRIEQQFVRQGGFALIAGEPGIGKSVALRLLADRLERTDGLEVAVLTHSTSNVGNFYREMADLFGITLIQHNLWMGFKELRQCWIDHFESTRMRPVLLVDEAQEVLNPVLTEIRLLTSAHFDSRAILSVVLAGDNRLTAKLRSPDLQPVASRIRHRLLLERAEPHELARLLDHILEQAGNPVLITAGLKETLVAHSNGNPRALVIMADILLTTAAEQDREVLDEKLFFEIWGEPAQPKGARR